MIYCLEKEDRGSRVACSDNDEKMTLYKKKRRREDIMEMSDPEDPLHTPAKKIISRDLLPREAQEQKQKKKESRDKEKETKDVGYKKKTDWVLGPTQVGDWCRKKRSNISAAKMKQRLPGSVPHATCRDAQAQGE